MLSAATARPPLLNGSFFWRLALGIVLGFSLCFILYVSHLAPRIFHEQWLTRGSAYPVEDQYLDSNLFRRLRAQGADLGLSEQNIAMRFLAAKHRAATESALAIIPAGDGERVLWELQLDVPFWQRVEQHRLSRDDAQAALDTFEKLTRLPMTSVWAQKSDRFVFASKLADAYLTAAPGLGFSSIELTQARKLIITRMAALEPRMEPEFLLTQPHLYAKIEPLVWNEILLAAATQLIHPAPDAAWECDDDAIEIVGNTQTRLRELATRYTPILRDAFSQQWLARARHHAQTNYLAAIRRHC